MNIDKLIESCYNALPSNWRQKPWLHLNHGRAVFDSENQLNAYIASYGEMHVIKCRMAMQNFPFDDLVFSICDAIGTPLCITIDDETLNNDTVTIRDRDTMEQVTVKVDELINYINEKIDL